MSEKLISRRSVLQSLAAGSLLIGCRSTGDESIEKVDDGAKGAKGAKKPAKDLDPDIFLRIAPDGLVTIVTHRSEMGTGIRTALPTVVADELGADWSRVEIEQGIGDARFGSQNTDGSRSVRRFFDRMREAGATARTMLERAAAAEWGVDASECSTSGHAVVHEKTKRRLDFKDVVAAAAELPVPKKEELLMRPASEYKYIGKDVPLTDLDEILTGKAVYGLDLRKEGMLYAVVARSPVLGAPVKSFDAAAAKAVAGVVDVVEIPAFQGVHNFQALGGVAVLASSTWAALEGRKALEAEWGESPNSVYDSKRFEKTLADATHKKGKKARSVGDAEAALAAAPKESIVEADYYVPHLAHAPMEPPCALAQIDGNRCEIWAPTQNPQAAQTSVAQALKMRPEDVIVNVSLLGGGFGRKSKPDYVVEAALLAKQTGKPVHVTWTREDDIRFDYFHTVAAMHIEASVDDKGLPSAWLQRSAFPTLMSTFVAGAKNGGGLEMGMGFTDLPYDVPNLLVENCAADAHVRIGWLRAVAHIYHAFAISSFPDELAHRVGRDPLEHLLELLGKDRHLGLNGLDYPNHKESLEKYPFDVGRLRKVTERAAELADWKSKSGKLPKGRGVGIASHRCFLSYVANVVEVEVDQSGILRIPHIHVVIDPGQIIHPDMVRHQMEGGAMFAASHALMGEITASGGSIDQSNFHDFEIAKIDEAPQKVSVEIMESNLPPAGVGEVGVPAIAPAICNAIFAATGKRIRRLPISKHDLSWS